MATAFQADAFQNNAFQIDAASSGAAVGGGGFHGWRTAGDQQRYLAYAKRRLKRKLQAEEDVDRELEIAWNKANGIEAPQIVELPAADEARIDKAIDRIRRVPKRAAKERERLLIDLARMIAELRAEAILEQQQMLADEEEEAVVVMLLSFP